MPLPPHSSSITDENRQVAAAVVADLGDRGGGDEIRGQAALHVARAAAPDPAVGHLARPRLVLPEIGALDRHDVDVAVQVQRASAARPCEPRRRPSSGPRTAGTGSPRTDRESAASASGTTRSTSNPASRSHCSTTSCAAPRRRACSAAGPARAAARRGRRAGARPPRAPPRSSPAGSEIAVPSVMPHPPTGRRPRPPRTRAARDRRRAAGRARPGSPRGPGCRASPGTPRASPSRP